MALDINRALMYADATGQLQAVPTRRRFAVVDGIVAGEGVGPIYASPARLGLVLAGFNPVAVDVVATEIAGFDHTRIPMLANAVREHALPLLEGGIAALEVRSESGSMGLAALRLQPATHLAAPLGWVGHMERAPDSIATAK
jgi:hypothetical protein